MSNRKKLKLIYDCFVAGAFIAVEKSRNKDAHNLRFNEEEIRDYVASVMKQLTDLGYEIHLELPDSILGDLQEKCNDGRYQGCFEFKKIDENLVVGILPGSFLWHEKLEVEFFSILPLEIYHAFTSDDSVDALFYRRTHTPVHFCRPKELKPIPFRAVQFKQDAFDDFANKVYTLNEIGALDDDSELDVEDRWGKVNIESRQTVLENGWVVRSELNGKSVFVVMSDEAFRAAFDLLEIDEHTEEKAREVIDYEKD